MGSKLFLSLSCDAYGQKQLWLEIRLVATCCRRRWYRNGQGQGGAGPVDYAPFPLSFFCLPRGRVPGWAAPSRVPSAEHRLVCLPLLQSWLHRGRLSLPQSIAMVSAPNTVSVTLLTSPALEIAAWTCSLCPPFPGFSHLPVGRSAPRDGVLPNKAW